MENPQLSELERRAYRAVVDDGLLDILLGIMLLGFGLVTTTDVDYLPAVILVIAFPLWRRLRSTLIEPRIGHVGLHASRMSKIRRGKRKAMALFFLLTIALIAFILLKGSLGSQSMDLRSIIVAVVLGIPIAAGGFLLEMKRWVAYALLMLAAGIFEHVNGLANATGLFLSGSAVVASGLFLLARFLYRHPVPPNEASLDV